MEKGALGSNLSLSKPKHNQEKEQTNKKQERPKMVCFSSRGPRSNVLNWQEMVLTVSVSGLQYT